MSGGDSATRARAAFRFRVPLPDDFDKAQIRLTWPTMQLDDTAHIDVRFYRLTLDPATTGMQHRSEPRSAAVSWKLPDLTVSALAAAEHCLDGTGTGKRGGEDVP